MREQTTGRSQADARSGTGHSRTTRQAHRRHRQLHAYRPLRWVWARLSSLRVASFLSREALPLLWRHPAQHATSVTSPVIGAAWKRAGKVPSGMAGVDGLGWLNIQVANTKSRVQMTRSNSIQAFRTVFAVALACRTLGAVWVRRGVAHLLIYRFSVVELDLLQAAMEPSASPRPPRPRTTALTAPTPPNAQKPQVSGSPCCLVMCHVVKPPPLLIGTCRVVHGASWGWLGAVPDAPGRRGTGFHCFLAGRGHHVYIK